MGAMKTSCLPLYLQEPDSHLGKGSRLSDAGQLPEAVPRFQPLDLGRAEAPAHSTAPLDAEQQAAGADQAASSQAAEARHNHRAAGAAALPLHTQPEPNVIAAATLPGQQHQQDQGLRHSHCQHSHTHSFNAPHLCDNLLGPILQRLFAAAAQAGP